MAFSELTRPERYLALLAEAAGRLLAAEDHAAMVEDLFELIRSELKLDVFFNYRADPEGALTLVAHGGLAPEQAMAGASLRLGQAICGCAARDRQPIHATDVQSSDDPMVEFIKGVGLDAYACTPLMWGEELLGTLGFGRRVASRFAEDELRFLQTCCRYVALAKHRLKIEEELRGSLKSKERLLSELNHRVRNSLQLVASLTRLTRASAATPEIARALLGVEERVTLIAAVHQQLYKSEHPGRLAMSRLLSAVAETVGVGEAPRPLVAAGLDADLNVSIDTAVPLGLLLQEIVVSRLEAVGAPPPVLDARRLDESLRVEIEWGRPPGAEREDRLAFSPILLKQLRGDWIEAGETATAVEIPFA